MPELLENGEDADKGEDESTEESDLAMERVPTADGSNAEGTKTEINGEIVQTNPDAGDELAMVPVDGDEGSEVQPSPKPPATVRFIN